MVSVSSLQIGKSPLVTLKAQARKFDFAKLRADSNNAGAVSGRQTYLDINRVNFVINGKNIDRVLTTALIKGAERDKLEKSWSEHCKYEKDFERKTSYYKKLFEEFYSFGNKYSYLILEEKVPDYRTFIKHVFIGLFSHAGVQAPGRCIMEELVTNCNQAGYLGSLMGYDRPLTNVSREYGLGFVSTYYEIHINFDSIKNCAKIKVGESISTRVIATPEEELCRLSSSLEFTLESYDANTGVMYKDGKLFFTVPRKLRDYKIGKKGLFDVIKDYFYEFCKKLGFNFVLEIQHGLGDYMAVVNSDLEDVVISTNVNVHNDYCESISKKSI